MTQGEICGSCIFFPKFLVCKRFYHIHGKDGVCPGVSKKKQEQKEDKK